MTDLNSLPVGQPDDRRTDKRTLTVESYIVKVSRSGTIAVRKSFRDGFVKISKLTDAEIKENINKEKKYLEEEMKILEKQEQLRKHLNKLREIRNGRKS